MEVNFIVFERHLRSKSGNGDLCEDAIFVGESYAAVIDGATTKSERRWDGDTSGRVAAKLLCQALSCLPATADARSAIDYLTSEIRIMYTVKGVESLVKKNPKDRVAASIAIFSFTAQQVWLVGDCQALIGNQLVSRINQVDRLLAAARAAFLELELAEGVQVSTLMANDPGRMFIRPLLERQFVFQNNPSAGDLWYPVMDGFEVPDEGIVVVPVPSGADSVVLATDGYPQLCSSLDDSEAMLRQLLATDPLLTRQFRSTKGRLPCNESHDDRAYLKLVRSDSSRP